ncbi:MAG: hypothetical protein ACJ77U_04620 [Chloroflexota bacterium]
MIRRISTIALLLVVVAACGTPTPPQSTAPFSATPSAASPAATSAPIAPAIETDHPGAERTIPLPSSPAP